MKIISFIICISFSRKFSRVVRSGPVGLGPTKEQQSNNAFDVDLEIIVLVLETWTARMALAPFSNLLLLEP